MRLLLGLLFTFTATVAIAAPSPVPPWYAQQSGDAMKDPVGNGKNAARQIKFTYDPAVDGGSAGLHYTRVSLPKDALIIRSFAYVVRAFTYAPGATVAAGCEDGGNIFPTTNANQLTAGRLIEGTNLGTLATIASTIGAPCVISTVSATAAVSTGKINFYVEYLVKDAS